MRRAVTGNELRWTWARASVGYVLSRLKRRWFLVVVRPEPVRDKRRDDQQALEEIRRLFARYREVARHGQAKERDDSLETRAREVKRAERLSGR